jgi:kynureninase
MQQAPRFDPEPWRARFPILASTNYLVSHSLGAMPATVYDKLRAFADQWATRGVRAWGEGWWSAPVDVGNVLAKLLNAPAGSVVMHTNVSQIEALVASSLDFNGPRNKVVYTDQNFPTVMYVWQGFERHGAKIHVVKSADGLTVPTEQLLEAIDEQTLIVPISHVFYKSSYLQDAAAICKRAREVGALVLLDTYQSLGCVPVDVQALGVDMVCGGSVKWLCGGPGAGYLYVRPDLLPRFEPSITGWAASAAPFDFEPRQHYAQDTRRMLNGSPAVAALYAATAGYEILNEVGVGAVRAYSQQMTEHLRGQLLARGFALHSPSDPARRGGSLTIGLRPDENGKAIVAALAERGILVDYRPGAGIRVSPHFYNRISELDQFAEALADLRATKSWQAHAAKAKSY